jgi:transcription elongation factor
MENLENVVVESVETVADTTETSEVVNEVRKPGRTRKVQGTPEEIAAAQEAKAQRKAEKDAARKERLEARLAKRQAKVEERATLKAQRQAERAAKRAFQIGQAVKIVSGEFAGIQGLVAKCARKRVHIAVQGQKKQAYCLIEEVTAL